MELTEYGFKNAVGAFFEMPTSDARKILPAHLQPLEVQHERSILAVTAFQFTQSMVGEYDEVVMSVIVPPIMEAGRPLPKAAFYPFVVGVTTDASRRHAIERWHLPHYMKDLQMDFTETEDELSLSISDEGQPVLDLSVTNFPGAPEIVLFNAFTVNEEDRFKGQHLHGRRAHRARRGSRLTHATSSRDDRGAHARRHLIGSVPGTVVPRRTTDVRGVGADLGPLQQPFQERGVRPQRP